MKNVPVTLSTEESAGNYNPLNRRYFLDWQEIPRERGETIMREMRANGSLRDVTEGQRGLGIWRFYYEGEAPEEMAAQGFKPANTLT